MGKIKVCYLVSSLCNEGPVNVIYNIIHNIDRSRFDVSIITLTPEKKYSRMHDFENLSIQIFKVAPHKRVGPICSYIRLYKLIKRIDPHIIHGHCSRPLYLMSFLPHKYKTAYTIHIYPGEQNIAISGWVKGNIIIKLDNFFTSRCNMPICCSESISEMYKQRKKIEYLAIPNGSVMPIWKYSQSKKMHIRTELGLPPQKKYFIFIGRFSKEKNPYTLVNAFAKIANPDIQLIMLGDGPLWESIKSRNIRNVLLLGFTTNVEDYLKASDYYISTSNIEGLANTVLESMAIGLPMILSDIPSHREVMRRFTSNQEFGYLVDGHKEDEIVDAINKIISLNSTFIRNKVQEVYAQNYTAQIMAAKYERIYEQLFHM